jgi:Zn-dependent protease
MAAMARGQFAVFGIPVTVNPFFIFGILIIAQGAGTSRAVAFTAIALALFTLIHELGHAITARRYGCPVSIHLSFLMGFASFGHSDRLTKRGRIIISLAGPIVQLATALAVLAALYNRAQAAHTQDAYDLVGDMWEAVVFAGVLIALLNLVPLWPLDGGHVIGGLLNLRNDRDSTATVARFTLGACVALFVAMLVIRGADPSWLDDRGRDLDSALTPGPVGETMTLLARGSIWWLLNNGWIILFICGLGSWQTLKALQMTSARFTVNTAPSLPTSDSRRAIDPLVMEAERRGWASGGPTEYPDSWGPSPWLMARFHLAAGHEPAARAALSAVARDSNWVAPDAHEPQLRPLMPLLPNPLLVGDRRSSLWLLEILSQHGDGPAIGAYGTALYSQLQDVEALYLVAAGFARLGHLDDAMSWLTRAVQEMPDARRLGIGKDFQPLHSRFDFQQLLAQARVAR